jgi:23S rRNA A2030 N6-methylase RlmJ
MLIINPPWTLQATLKDTMPYLVDALGVDDAATFSIQVSGAETAKPTKDRTRKSAHDE